MGRVFLVADPHVGKGYVLLVSQYRVGFRLTLAVSDRRSFEVADGKRVPDGNLLRSSQSACLKERINDCGNTSAVCGL